MKKIILFTFFMASTFLLRAQHSFNTAVEYNDYIINQQTEVAQAIITLMNATHDDSATTWAAYRSGIEITKYCLQNIENLGAYNGDDQFKYAAVDLFKFYVDVYSNEYYEIMLIVTKPDYSKADYPRIDQFIASITDREAILDHNFKAAQDKFAVENNFDLIDKDDTNAADD